MTCLYELYSHVDEEIVPGYVQAHGLRSLKTSTRSKYHSSFIITCLAWTRSGDFPWETHVKIQYARTARCWYRIYFDRASMESSKWLQWTNQGRASSAKAWVPSLLSHTKTIVHKIELNSRITYQSFAYPLPNGRIRLLHFTLLLCKTQPGSL